MQEKNKNPLLVGILSIVMSLLFALGGILLGIAGIMYANELQKESGLDYKTEKILNIVGLVVSVLNWIVTVAVFFRIVAVAVFFR